jgi:hypothetical protein
MRLTSNGNLGIGTIGPTQRLDVAGNVKISGDLMGGSDDFLGIYPNTSAWDSRAWLALWGPHETRAGEAELAGTYINLRYGSTTASWGNIGLRLASDGNVGIGTISPQYKLDVAGTIRGDNVSPSDRRWKADIVPLEGALERVTQLRGVRFRWNDPSRGTGPQIGVIAQEVEQVFPEVVSTDSEGYKSVAYDRLVAPLIEAVKELKAENEALKAENSRMKEEFERRITALEAVINQD